MNYKDVWVLKFYDFIHREEEIEPPDDPEHKGWALSGRWEARQMLKDSDRGLTILWHNIMVRDS